MKMLKPMGIAVLMMLVSLSVMAQKKTITLPNYEPNGNGYVISNPTFEVSVGRYGVTPNVGDTEVEIGAWVKLKGGSVVGYKYNGTIYRDSDITLIENRLTPSIGNLGMGDTKVSGSVSYKGSNIGSFSDAVVNNAPVWKDRVNVDNAPTDYSVRLDRITSARRMGVEQEIQSVLSKQTANKASTSSSEQSSSGVSTSSISSSSGNSGAATNGATNNETNVSSYSSSSTGSSKSSNRSVKNNQHQQDDALQRQIEFRRESQQRQQEALQSAAQGLQSAISQLARNAEQRRVRNADREAYARQVNSRVDRKRAILMENANLVRREQAQLIEDYTRMLQALEASPKIGTLSEIANKVGDDTDMISFLRVSVRINQVDDFVAPGPDMVGFYTSAKFSSVQPYAINDESIYISSDVEEYYKPNTKDLGDYKPDYDEFVVLISAEKPEDVVSFAEEFHSSINGKFKTVRISAPNNLNSPPRYNSEFKEIYERAQLDAAHQGYVPSQNNVGVLYEKREKVREAIKWYRKAAEQGYAEAQYNLGYMYERGWAVKKDFGEVVRWYRKAAEQNHVVAQYKLGLLFYKGEGQAIAKDDIEAIKWFRRAAEQGDSNAQVYLGNMYVKGMGTSQDLREAANWYRQAAEQGNQYGQYNLGLLFETGRGVIKDTTEANRWYRLAAEQGYAEAKSKLGLE